MIGRKMSIGGGRFKSTPPSGNWAVLFNGTTSGIDCGNHASLQDIPNGDFTAEAWVYRDVYTEPFSFVVGKAYINVGGWAITSRYSAYQLAGLITLSTTTAEKNIIPTAYVWQHIALTWDISTLTEQLFIDGVSQGTAVGSGSYVSDAAYNLKIGQDQQYGRSWNGYIAGVRLSNVIRYTTTFIPYPKDNPPAVDSNTIEQWNLNDGSGSIAVAEVNSLNDGVLTNCSWIEL